MYSRTSPEEPSPQASYVTTLCLRKSKSPERVARKKVHVHPNSPVVIRKRNATLSRFAAILVLATLYVAGGRVGQLVAIQPGYVSAIWPSSGVAFAAVLLLGKRVWPGIWLGSFLFNTWVYVRHTHTFPSTVPLITASLIAAGATFGALGGALLLRRLRKSSDFFSNTNAVMQFFTIGVVASCLINATTGAAALYAMGVIGSADFFRSWWTWWLGDAAGVLVMTPLVVICSRIRIKSERSRLPEFLLLLVLLGGAATIAFGTVRYPFPYVVLPFLIVITLRFRQIGASVGIALVALIGLILTASGRGPFAQGTAGSNQSLLLFGSFILLNGVTIMILAAAWCECATEALNATQERESSKSAKQQMEMGKIHAATLLAANECREKELESATELQLSLLPDSLPETPGFEAAARMQSASSVGGDYYNVISRQTVTDVASPVFCVADVSGKGLVASLIMSNFQAMLLSLAKEPMPLAELASRLGALLQIRYPSKYVTSIMLQLNWTTGIGSYVSAGHTNGILLRQNGQLEWLRSTGVPLGMFANSTYQEEAIQVRPGDLLALLSDGLIDALNIDGLEFGEANLVNYLRQTHCQSATEIVSGTFDLINRFIGSAPQFDDITLIVIKVMEVGGIGEAALGRVSDSGLAQLLSTRESPPNIAGC